MTLAQSALNGCDRFYTVSAAFLTVMRRWRTLAPPFPLRSGFDACIIRFKRLRSILYRFCRLFNGFAAVANSCGGRSAPPAKSSKNAKKQPFSRSANDIIANETPANAAASPLALSVSSGQCPNYHDRRGLLRRDASGGLRKHIAALRIALKHIVTRTPRRQENATAI